jgi:hypothetical protein
MIADVAAKSYDMAARKLVGLINKYEKGKANRVIVENPRDRTSILVAETKPEVEQTKQIVEDWRAYAKWLRGLVDRYENSAGLHRYVAKYEMEEALSLDQAMTEGIAAMNRATSQSNRYSVSEPKPPEGSVRLYRGQEGQGEAAGNWWTANPGKAASFAAGGRVFAVDVPERVVEMGRQAAQEQGQGGDTIYLPPEMNRLAAPVEVETPVIDLEEEPEGPRYSVTSGKPERPPAQVATMPIADFAVWAKTIPDGITGEAVRVGRAVTTPEEIAELEQLRDQSKGESSELMKAGDFDNAMAAATRAQYFREAYETATNTGSMAHAAKTGRLTGADEQPHTPSEEGSPPASTVFGDHDKDYTSRYSVSNRPDPDLTFLPIKNASMEQSFRELGIARSLPEALGKPDSQLLRDVQERMARDPTWVDSIVDREQKKPGLLSDEEVMALDYWMLDLRNSIRIASQKAEQAEDAGLTAEAAGYRRQVDFWSEALIKLSDITKRSGTESARAFRARQLALKWDFTVDTLYHEKRKAQGWKKITQEEKEEMLRDLEKKAREMAETNAQLEVENQKLREQQVEAEKRQAERDVEKINPEVMQFARDWVKEYNRSAKNARDRLKVKWARAFPESPLRASVTGEPAPLPEDLMRELAIIGGAKLASNITEQQAWEKAMVDDLGPNVRPHLAAARQAAEAHLAERLAKGRAEMRALVTPRRATGAPKPTVEQEIEATKTKIHQVAEHQKTSTEPIKTAEDELYYPVQRLIRQLIEQDPFITREELIKTVHDILTVSFPEMTVEETMDTISGRGRVRRPAQDDISKTIRDLKAQIRILANINDTEAYRPTKRTGFQPDKPTDEQRRLEQRLNRAKKLHGEVVTDDQYQLSSYLDSRKTWYRNRIADLRWEMENRRLIADSMPELTEKQREAKERAIRELEPLKQEYDLVRQEHAEIFQRPDLTDEQRLEMAERAAERVILKMEEDLAAGRRTAAGKRDPVASAKLEAQRTRIAQLKAEQEWAQRHLNPPPDLSKKEDYLRWFHLDREIRKIQRQLAEQDVFPVSKKIRPTDTASNQRMAQQLEDLKIQRKEMRDRLGPGKLDPVTKAINLRISQLERQIADYQQRMADRNFEPRKQKKPLAAVAKNDKVVSLLAKREQIKKDFYNEVARDRWDRKTNLQKVGHGINLTRTAITNLRSSFDFSAARQGLPGLIAMASRVPFSRHPIRVTARLAKVFGQMFQAAFSRKKAEKINQTIRLKPNYDNGTYKLMNIEFSDIESPTFTRAEENARSIFDEWAQVPMWTAGKPIRNILTAPVKGLVAKPVAASNRAFATFLNVLRSELADTLLEANYKDRAPTPNELQILGYYVNVATGRGYIKPSRVTGYSNFIWAPKLLASRVQFLAGAPLWGSGKYKDSARVRRIIAQEYARVLISGYMLYLISRMFDEKDEKDLRSSDAGKIKRGNTRIDIWGGFQQPLVLFSRFATGETKTLKGRVVDLVSAEKYGGNNLLQTGVRFARSKLRPDIGVATDLILRQDFLGRPITPGNILRDLVVPLPFADMVEIMKDRGYSEGAILMMFNLFGVGINVYEEESKYPRETRTQ